jgi:hypothetical protein
MPMNRLLAAVSVCVVLAAPDLVQAQTAPPPLRVKVLLAMDPHLDDAARADHDAFLRSLSAGGPTGGWFEFQPTGLEPADFEHCTISAQDPRSCVSGLLIDREAPRATIIVLAYGSGEDARWHCIGTGQRPPNVERQSIRFDMGAALGPGSPRRMAARSAGAGCITSAGAESGW